MFNKHIFAAWSMSLLHDRQHYFHQEIFADIYKKALQRTPTTVKQQGAEH